MEKLPPVEKVFEAWTAIADRRVELKTHEAVVSSSDGTKTYTVRFNGDIFSSDDNASYWRGYAGYPVIAVLMLQGRLPLDMKEADRWKDINWKNINARYKNKYSEAVREIASERSINILEAYKKAENVLEALQKLPLAIKRKIQL